MGGGTAGLIIGGYGSFGVEALDDTGRLRTTPATDANINNKNTAAGADRSIYCPIVPNNLDYAVKSAMTDGIGAAWTDAQRLAVLLSMGCTVDENGFVKWTATPSE